MNVLAIAVGPAVAREPNAHLSAPCTLPKVVFSLEPSPCTTAMIATEMPAAMRPYSMAVAPDSFLRKREKRLFIIELLDPRVAEHFVLIRIGSYVTLPRDLLRAGEC